MADKRLCGYCRKSGHVATKCPVKAGLIETVRRHVGRQRTDLQTLMLSNGFGIGALVNAYAYQVGRYVPCLITQQSLDSLANMNMVEFYNIRYSKRVTARLFTYSGNTVAPDSEEVYNYNRTSIYMSMMPLETGISDIHAAIHPAQLKIGPNTNPQRFEAPKESTWEHYCELLSPSDEGRMSDLAMYKPVQLSRRITDSYVTPILP